MQFNLEEFQEYGFCITEPVFLEEEVNQLIGLIEKTEFSGSNFRHTSNLFAIRQLLQEIAALKKMLRNEQVRRAVREFGSETHFCTKAIYFDKPALSNWTVGWHQDVMISVHGYTTAAGFGPWSSKESRNSVRPPRFILEDTLTLRLHLDDCDETNGALQVIPGSHRKGILSATDFEEINKKAETCSVKKGGMMVMKPLLVHASKKSTSARPRRVIHLEFSSLELPEGLTWSERVELV